MSGLRFLGVAYWDEVFICCCYIFADLFVESSNRYTDREDSDRTHQVDHMALLGTSPPVSIPFQNHCQFRCKLIVIESKIVIICLIILDQTTFFEQSVFLYILCLWSRPLSSATQSVDTWPVAQRTAQCVFGTRFWGVVRRSWQDTRSRSPVWSGEEMDCCTLPPMTGRSKSGEPKM